MVVDQGILLKATKGLEGFVKTLKNNKVIKGLTAAKGLMDTAINFARKSEPIDRIISGIQNILGTPALVAVEFIVGQLQSQTSVAMAESIANIFLILDRPIVGAAITAAGNVLSTILTGSSKLTDFFISFGLLINQILMVGNPLKTLENMISAFILHDWSTTGVQIISKIGAAVLDAPLSLAGIGLKIAESAIKDITDTTFSGAGLKIAESILYDITNASFVGTGVKIVSGIVNDLTNLTDIDFAGASGKLLSGIVNGFSNVIPSMSFTGFATKFINQTAIGLASADYTQVAAAVLMGISNQLTGGTNTNPGAHLEEEEEGQHVSGKIKYARSD